MEAIKAHKELLMYAIAEAREQESVRAFSLLNGSRICIEQLQKRVEFLEQLTRNLLEDRSNGK